MQITKFPTGEKTKRTCFGYSLVIIAALFLLTGCSSLGSRRVSADRFNYNAAIAQSTKEQMLLNIVRSRYLEMPVFLTVSSVLTQYEYNGSIGVGGFFRLDRSADSVSGDLNLKFSERPTITYLPVEGQEFSAHLLSDISSEFIFAAGQAGWPIDIFMRVAVQRLGAIENMSWGRIPASGFADIKKQFIADLEKLKRFERMINLIFILSNRKVIEVQQIEEDGEPQSHLIIAEEVAADLRPMLSEFRQLLGLTNLNQFRITQRVTNLEDDEISIQTRSVLAIMEFMARGVEVPLAHLKEGRVIDYGLQSKDGEVAKELIPFRMRSSKDRPANTFAAVRFQDYWYYVDNSDVTSKRALNLLSVLFRLQAPTPAGAAPILTLPTG